jgi:hypothetical protein
MIDTFVDYTHWPLAVLFIAYAYTLWLRGSHEVWSRFLLVRGWS